MSCLRVAGLLRRSLLVPSVLAFSLTPAAVLAQFRPIVLTPDSFNHDIVVERTAPRPVTSATTASVQAGVTNTGFTWFEKGYNDVWPAAGLPAAGSIISSDLTMDREYQFAPDYRSNNAILIDSAFSHAEMALADPAPFAALSFLLSGAHESIKTPVAYNVRHADGSSEPGTIKCPDWLDSLAPCDFSAHGSVNVVTFAFKDLNSNLPKLYAAGITLTNRASPVTSVELSYVSGAGHSVIMAVSGAMADSGPFTPIVFTGYNADVVVEASAARPKPLLSVTTATMNSGAANVSWTWHERGYVPGAPDSGLPASGSFLTNFSSPEQVFVLPPAYAQNNTALLDSDYPEVNLVPTTPLACGLISLLSAAAGGPVTNSCIISFSDGSTETHWIVSPDWTNPILPPAFNAAGRVNVNNRMLENIGGSGPWLFASELELKNSTALVTNIAVQWSGGTNGHVAVLAVSGKPDSLPPEPASLSIRIEPGGAVVILSSAPGRLESTTALEGANTVWTDAGAISGPLTLPPESGARFYRVVR